MALSRVRSIADIGRTRANKERKKEENIKSRQDLWIVNFTIGVTQTSDNLPRKINSFQSGELSLSLSLVESDVRFENFSKSRHGFSYPLYYPR